jgi:hypothetical protein
MAVTINVALRRNGDKPPKHIFRTAQDSIGTRHEACLLAQKLSTLFPYPEYEITVAVELTYSKYLNWIEEEK